MLEKKVKIKTYPDIFFSWTWCIDEGFAMRMVKAESSKKCTCTEHLHFFNIKTAKLFYREKLWEIPTRLYETMNMCFRCDGYDSLQHSWYSNLWKQINLVRFSLFETFRDLLTHYVGFLFFKTIFWFNETKISLLPISDLQNSSWLTWPSLLMSIIVVESS